MPRLAPCLLALVLVSAAKTARANDGIGEIHVDRSDEAVIVRSGTDAANFLFRAPPAFAKTREAKKPFQIELVHGESKIRLYISMVAPADLRKHPSTLARARESAYREGKQGKLAIAIDGVRARVTIRGEGADRTVLLVRDGKFLYELWLDGGKELNEVADGFTILDPKGAPIAAQATPGQLKAKKLEHDYYRLKILKPEGFRDEPVDVDADRGIWKYLRAEHEDGSVCQIRMRVHLAKTVKKSLSAMAQTAIDKWAKRYPKGKVPKAPKRARWPASKEAYRVKLSGRLAKTGLVIQEERVFLEHENGRIYDIQVTTYAGALRAYKKQLKAFWKSIKIANR